MAALFICTLKQYIYSAQEAGLDSWPSGTLRLHGIEETRDPSKADIFVVPGSLRIFEVSGEQGLLDHDALKRLPYFAGNESAHVFFDCSDNFTQPLYLPILFIRCDVRTWMLPHDPNTLQMAWPVADLAECMPIPDGGFKYDVSFQGWLSSNVRRYSSDACLNHQQLKCDIARHDDFYGYIENEPEGHRRRREFLRSLQESRVSLCPESIPGVLPYRFFEAMSAGRVPVLISEHYVLPFADEIPYDDFILRIAAPDSDKAGDVIRRYLDVTTDAELIEKGKKARQSWEQWLDCRRWPELHSYAVQKQLGLRMQCAS